MAHHTVKTGYQQLTERLNRFPQGAPPSEVLYRILALLFSEKEAALVALLPIKPFTAKTAAAAWSMSIVEATTILDNLAGRAILLDVEIDGQTVYTLPPPMAGFFEFSMMRVRTDIDQHLLAELFHQYINVEEDFIRDLMLSTETRPGRVFVQEPALSPENTLVVLDYERASQVIQTAAHISVGTCYCRHKMAHLGQACSAPTEICMTFNNTADSLARHGYARSIDAVEATDLLQLAYQSKLVQFGENVRHQVSFICNCCGCCCEAMLAARRFGILNPVQTTNFLPVIDIEQCTGCGKCVSACPVQAMTLISACDPQRPGRKIAHLEADLCLGCGVCVRSCPHHHLSLSARPERLI
ncbi:MAG TPA: 4Fe-4S binding protein, partial [Anaerolineaceae bacterium]|nr:4Fe-4S binding protein [Anaerolineaceae bacterium]